MDARELANQMSRIVCVSGQTQIGKILAHIRKEHGAQPVSAAVFVGDMCEETAYALQDAATGLGVRVFVCFRRATMFSRPRFFRRSSS